MNILHRPFASSWSRWEHQEINYYGWWAVIHYQNRAPVVFTEEVRIFPRTGKTTAKETECEGHACWLQLLKFKCTMNSLVEVKQWTRLSVWHHLQELVWKKQVKLWQKDSCFFTTAMFLYIWHSVSGSFSQKNKIALVAQPTCISPANFTCSLNHKLV